MNVLLYNDTKMLTIERENTTQKTTDLHNAARVLCRPEYKHYKHARKDAIRELHLERTEDGSQLVCSNVMSCVPVSVLSMPSGCIACNNCVAHERQCKHEICLTGGTFNKSRFLVRHLMRSRLAISTNGWSKQTTNEVSEMLGMIETMNL